MQIDSETLTNLIKQGLSQREIAKKLGTTQNKVARRVRDAGLRVLYKKGAKPPKPCKTCGKPLNTTQRKAGIFCSVKCHNRAKFMDKYTEWLDGENAYPTATTYTALKRALYETYGWQCAICHISVWQGRAAPLELDHIDGDAHNNRKHNVRWLCPNCHAQTDTYKGRNKGKGTRVSRKSQ